MLLIIGRKKTNKKQKTSLLFYFFSLEFSALFPAGSSDSERME